MKKQEEILSEKQKIRLGTNIQNSSSTTIHPYNPINELKQSCIRLQSLVNK